jgi:pilus assembly protein FimV
MTSTLLFSTERNVRAGGIRLAVAMSLVLQCWPMAADALSLGRSRGAALLGRPLDVSILATLEPQEATPEASCFSPEVFYGDTLVGSQNVSVTPVRTSPTELSLRVRSSLAIDEPFVTVYVRSACGSNVSRRYVLLSDSPSEPAPSVQAPVVPFVAPAAPVARLPSAAPAGGSPSTGAVPSRAASVDPEEAARRAERAAKRAALRQEQRQAAKAASAKAQADAATKEVEASTSPLSPRAEAQRLAKARTGMSPTLGSSTKTNTGRLKVDLLDPSSGRDPSLRASAELLSLPTSDLQTRAQAAAIWRAINSSPEDILRDTERLKVLETEVRAMSELTKRQTKDLGTLKSDLVQAQRGQYANPFVYALGALALAALAFAAWIWQRSRSASAPWWGSAQSPKSSSASSERKKSQPARFNSQALSAAEDAERDRERELGFVAASQLVTPPSAAMPLSASPGVPPAVISRTSAQRGLDMQSRHPSAELLASVAERRPVPSERRGGDVPSGFEPSAVAGLRPVNAEELFDIQQQADFFMSLGQHAQAIDILQNHIGENVETSALAYLDLFDIYHKVGLREDFAALREEFNRVFNAQVPEYAQYGRNSRGLEDYASAMERITVLWPNVKVLEVIEESIFRKPDRDNQPFDLLAYRELMLLYAVAKDVCENEGDVGEMRVDFDMTQPPDISFSLDDDHSAAGAPQPARGRYSATELQPLSTAVVPPLGANAALQSEASDDWEEALKKLPLVSKHIGVDIELDLFEESPAAAPQASPAAAPKEDNSIDFDAATSRDFRPSRPSKL